jgi:hypothetical protein
MGYVGNQTTNAYTSMDKQDITGNGGTSYTLSHAVANAQEIEVYVNNVRQEPNVAYTTNGTALNMTGNVVSTDDFYVVFQGKAVGTVVPPDGSVGTAKLASGSVTAAKLAAGVQGVAGITSASTSGTAINIDSSNRVTMPARPAFLARRNGTNITLNGAYFPFDSTSVGGGFDIGSNYDTTNYKFTCPVAGVYFFSFYAIFQSSSASKPKLRQNGTDHSQSYASDGNDTWNTCHLNVHVNAAANDFFQIFVADELQTYGNTWAGFSGHLVG